MRLSLNFIRPKEARSFICAATHRKWFEIMKWSDVESKLITINKIVKSSIQQIPKDQHGYNKAFLQRITRHLGQARIMEVVFEMRTERRFQEIKTNNIEKSKKYSLSGNVSNQMRRDSIGFITHVYPR